MSLTLDQKQLVRSISDIIVHNPESARMLLKTQHIAELDIFSQIRNVISFVTAYREDEILSNSYQLDLKNEIDKVTNKEMKIILESSFSIGEFSE